jgi:hypothetical protein
METKVMGEWLQRSPDRHGIMPCQEVVPAGPHHHDTEKPQAIVPELMQEILK